jgi:hypothetical protein
MHPVWTISKLPNEVLIEILSHFSKSPGTLAKCALVSRRWFNLAAPLLWRFPRLSAMATPVAWHIFVDTLTASVDAGKRGRLYHDMIYKIHDLWLFTEDFSNGACTSMMHQD